MIAKCDDCEYSITIADLMVTLSHLDSFELKILIGNNVLPNEYSEKDDFKFLQESLKVVTDSTVEYIFYDIIHLVEIKYASERMAT